MTSDEKLEMLTQLLDADGVAAKKLDYYLQIAEKEILTWRYSYAAKMPDKVPEEYEMTQIQAVIAGFNMSGAENQTQHSENGITRSFRYADMLAYIRSHVIPFAGVY